MSADRTVTDLETTALGVIQDCQDVLSLPEVDRAVAAVRELARRATGAQTLRDALERAAATLTVITDRFVPGIDTWEDTDAEEVLAATRAALATPDTPGTPWDGQIRRTDIGPVATPDTPPPTCPQCGGRGTESRSWDDSPEKCAGCDGTGVAPDTTQEPAPTEEGT